MKYDVVIVGGGTSGMMAAITAAKNGAQVAIIEKNKQLGKKLRLTGGGRCNVTNNRPPEEIIQFIPGNGKFLYSAFSQFNNYDIMTFFEENNIPLKEEDHGRMFPVANTSKAIVSGLVDVLNQEKVTILTKTTVTEIRTEHDQISGLVLDSGEEIETHCVVLTTGGKTYQYTGSTGDGYRFAKKLGHTITKLFPTESPIKSHDQFVQHKTLQGLALRDVTLSVLNEKQKIIVSHQMDLLFTHFGVSGPAALRCSMFVNQELAKGQKFVPLEIDSLPEKSSKTLIKDIQALIEETPKKSVKNGLKGLLPDRYLEFLLTEADLIDIPQMNMLNEPQIEQFVGLVKAFPMTAYDTYPLDKSFVTGGGVHLKEINPKTMESKIVEGLFFGGELLDINGYTGGFNITAAFVTGHVAGKSAAEVASYYQY